MRLINLKELGADKAVEAMAIELESRMPSDAEPSTKFDKPVGWADRMAVGKKQGNKVPRPLA